MAKDGTLRGGKHIGKNGRYPKSNIEKAENVTWAEYFEEQMDDWDTFTESDNYLYFLSNELISAKLSEKATKTKRNIVNEYRREREGAVVINKSVIADLIG